MTAAARFKVLDWESEPWSPSPASRARVHLSEPAFTWGRTSASVNCKFWGSKMRGWTLSP